uniref:Uncharacterized protein n=1 Tax=Arundo donax TaxID=35708 RepID=A0A0A9D3M5_ARUDO
MISDALQRLNKPVRLLFSFSCVTRNATVKTSYKCDLGDISPCQSNLYILQAIIYELLMR